MKLFSIFIFTCLIYSDEIINISLDPIAHNNFYLNSIHPQYQLDLLDKGHVIGGFFGIPLSVYVIKDLYTNINDSIRTNSSLLYRQGDAGYRKLAVDVKTKIDDSGIVKLLANGTTYPGETSQYATDNILQNYLLHFSKKYNSSDLSFYTTYHIENVDLKYINSNSGESYSYGMNYNIRNKNHETNFKYAFQIGQTNYNQLTDYNFTLGIFNSKYHLTKNIIPYIRNVYKCFYFDEDTNYLHNIKSGVILENNSIMFDIGFNHAKSDLPQTSDFPYVFPNVIFKSKFNYFNIKSGISNEYWGNFINHSSDDNKIILNSYQYLLLEISYKKNNVEIAMEPRLISKNIFQNQYFSFNNIININWNMFNSEFQVIPYFLSFNKTNVLFSLESNYYSSLELILNNHISCSLVISEIESHNRYKKFFGLKYQGIQFNNKYSIDLDELSIYSIGNSWSWNDNTLKNYLDLYFGVEFEKFIFSWHFTNILSENYIINTNSSIQNFDMTYFLVKWKFDD